MLDFLAIPLNYSHADSGHQKGVTYDQLSVGPEDFAQEKVVLLVRDPRDVVVSGYFQATRRKGIYTGNIGEFIRDPCHGIEKVVRFNDLWLAAASRMPNFLVVRYEDVHQDTVRELKRITEHLGRSDIGHERMSAAVEFAKFENMRRRESEGGFERQYGAALTPGSPSDTESYKTRRGKVGGFIDYLSEADIEYCNEVIEMLKRAPT